MMSSFQAGEMVDLCSGKKKEEGKGLDWVAVVEWEKGQEGKKMS